jgi:hypothetical protein
MFCLSTIKWHLEWNLSRNPGGALRFDCAWTRSRLLPSLRAGTVHPIAAIRVATLNTHLHLGLRGHSNRALEDHEGGRRQDHRMLMPSLGRSFIAAICYVSQLSLNKSHEAVVCGYPTPLNQVLVIHNKCWITNVTSDTGGETPG